MKMKKFYLKPDNGNMLIIRNNDKSLIGSIDFDKSLLKVLQDYTDDGEILFVKNYYNLKLETI